jgi:Fic family protein
VAREVAKPAAMTPLPITDRGETTALMEPLLIGSTRHKSELMDLVLELTQKSSALRSSLPVSIVSALAALVRSMNCYYSNLIEGHYTHPIDIDRALQADFQQDPEKRDLQIEAAAHIAVQTWIDGGGLASGQAWTVAGIGETHRRFYNLVPENLHWAARPDSEKPVRILPGELRKVDVKVGSHIAISPGAVPRFLSRFEEVYSKLGRAEAVLAVAAAHHRLVWIHPFLDGNGRVARLLSHAQFLELLDTGAIWSVARGLARTSTRYKDLLANCDLPRRNDLDGRGNLSEEALAEFTRYFLQVCIDQVNFMESLMQPGRLRSHVMLWAEQEIRLGTLPSSSEKVIVAVLYRGEIARSEVASLTTSDRQARRITAALLASGALQSESPRAPLRLAFPTKLALRWMPGLFPETPEES